MSIEKRTSLCVILARLLTAIIFFVFINNLFITSEFRTDATDFVLYHYLSL